MSTNLSPSERTRAVRAGLKAVGLWLLIEFGIRDIGMFAIFAPSVLSGRRLDPHQLMSANIALLWPATLVAGVVFLRLSRRRGLTWDSLGYRPWRSSVLIGLIAAAVDLSLEYYGVHHLTEYWFGTDRGEEFVQALKAVGLPITIAGLLPANGVLTPVVEELAWRGYIQTHLIRGWGLRSGVIVTALLFALKHVVVDFSYERILSLLTGSFLLGIVGYRWGTSASTVAHVLMNSAATVILTFEIWHQ